MKHYLDWKVYDGVCNVEQNFRTYFDLLLNKVSSLFIWSNLPETIDERFLEFNLILCGKVCWTEMDGKLYCLNGNIGGEPNVYYEPTQWIVANPVLGSKQVKIRNKDGSKNIETLDGILMANSDVDYESMESIGGLSGLIYQTAGLLADNISSLNVAQINGRVSTLFTADSTEQAKTAEKILQDIYSGKPYKVVEQDLVEKFGITAVAGAGTNNTLMSLIEAHQYILAQFFQEIGIQANYNMKRERLNTAEVEMNNGALDINVFNMLKNRQQAVEEINQKFGTNIEVSLNWAIFNENNGNADNDGVNEPQEVAQDDTESQVDGIQEDTISQPNADDEFEKLESAAKDNTEEIDTDNTEGGSDD